MGINGYKERLEDGSNAIFECSEKKSSVEANIENNYLDAFDIVCNKEEKKQEKYMLAFDSEEDLFERKINELENSKKSIVFSGKANENFDYGEGGGQQYFIQDAVILKEEGKLIPISKEYCVFNPLTDIYVSDIRRWDQNEGMTCTVHLDHRTLTQDNAEKLFDNVNFTENRVEKISNFGMEEIKYLDENTPADEALTEIANWGRGLEEDYRHPLGNQEDSKGFTHPDKWSNPRELVKGEIYYQLEPVFSNGSKTKSSYFTDKQTVDLCRDEEGNINLSKLMQKLQKSPNIEYITDEKGEKKEQYVKEYSIVQYIFNHK